MSEQTREFYGQLVRMAWIEWAKEQPDPKPSWLVPWAELSEPDREADRRIGETVRKASIDTRIAELEQSLAAAQQALVRGSDAAYWMNRTREAEQAQRDAEAERDRWRTDLNYVRRERTLALNRAEAAETDLQRAREALRAYGEHSVMCADVMSYVSAKCICGFDAALEATQALKSSDSP